MSSDSVIVLLPQAVGLTAVAPKCVSMRMASKKRQREIERAEKERELEKAASRRRRWIAFTIVSLLAAMVAVFVYRKDSAASSPNEKTAPMPDKWTLSALLKLKPHQIEELDVALLNLLCAEGLPGSETLDLKKSLTALDEMAQRVKVETDRHLYRFTQNSAEFNHSEADFRTVMMATVLQQDFGIRYNPARIASPDNPEPTAVFYANSKDFFIHGCTDSSRMGTCASLPVFYTAIARRLKYPLHVVATKGHLFARWQDDKERLNLEATSIGFTSYPDSKYHIWPYGVTAAEIASSKYLQNMSATEELGTFLSIRAFALFAAKRHHEAIEAIDAAIRFAPHIEAHRIVKTLLARQMTRTEIPGVYLPPPPHLRSLVDDLDMRTGKLRPRSTDKNVIYLPPQIPDPERSIKPHLYPYGGLLPTPPPLPPIRSNFPLPQHQKNINPRP